MRTLKLFSFLFLVLSCSTAPEFERENSNDPDSDRFIPDTSELVIEINKDKTVTLSWQDQSDFETGYVISKALGNEEKFDIIASLPANSTSFTDDSKNLSANTKYKVVGTSSTNNNPSTVSSTSLYFGSIDSLNTSSTGNVIIVEWDTTNIYADKYQLEYKTPQSTDWLSTELINRTENSFTISESSEDYELDILLSALVETSDNRFEKVAEKLLRSTPYNLPTNFEVKVLNEAQIEVSFSDQSEFDDRFIIYQSTGTLNCCDQPFSPLVSLDTLSESGQTVNLVRHENSVSVYRFFIAPLLLGSNTRGSNSTPFEYVLHMRPPSSYQIESDQTNSVTIRWNDGNVIGENDPVHSYYFEWSTDNVNFTSSESLSSSKTSYTINNIETSEVYYLRARTFNSSYSYAEINFENSFEEIRNIGIGLGPDRENDAISITENRIYQRNRIINLQDYSILSLSNTKKNDLVGGLALGDNTLYYSNDTEIRIDLYNKQTLEHITSYSDPEMMDSFSVNYLFQNNEVLLGFTRFGLNGDLGVVIQRWNEDFTEMYEEIELRNKSMDLCTTISYLVISDNEEIGLVLCNGFSNEGVGFDYGSVIKFNPYNLSESSQVLHGELVRDFIFENRGTEIIYYLSRGDVVKYDLSSNRELLRNTIFDRGLYDLSFSSSIDELYLVGTQRGLSSAKSTFFTVNSTNLEVSEEIELNNKYYFSRDVGNDLIYFAGEGSKIYTRQSKWLLK